MIYSLCSNQGCGSG